MTKLQLDDKIAADEGGAVASTDDGKTATEVKRSLLTTLRTKFKDEGGDDDDIVEISAEEVPSTQVKRARGVERD